ncbi:NADPH-dependent FMN reductase [Marinobacter sp. 1Y8]
MSDPIHIALILGSTREGRFCNTIAAWVSAQLIGRADLTVSVIDPLHMNLPQHHEKEPNAAILDLRAQLDRADAFIVVTPEYNHSFPAALKFVIDSAYREWQTKPVGFVSYGGISGGLRAVEQLRQVFAELHAMTVRDSVSFASVWNQFSNGRLSDPQRAESTLQSMLTQLVWWASTTRQGRVNRPYVEAG